MFKQIVTLVRGRTFDAAEQLADANAISILRQQIRDCAEAIDTARRATGLACAQLDQEKRHHEKLVERLQSLELRTLSALEQGKQELAREGAEAIAGLESERDASQAAQKAFAVEISKLKATLRNAESRLRELERGQRLAAAAHNTNKLRQSRSTSHLAVLKEAEDTLTRLRETQKMEEVAEAALTDMALTLCPEGIEDRLMQAGCGPAATRRADDVMTRLQARLQAGSQDPTVCN